MNGDRCGSSSVTKYGYLKYSYIFITITQLLLAQQKTNSQPGTFLQRLRPWGPHIDNNDVPSDIQVAFRYARIHDIPLLIGTTTADGADLVFMRGIFTSRKKIQWSSECINPCIIHSRHVSCNTSCRTNIDKIWNELGQLSSSLLREQNIQRFGFNYTMSDMQLSDEILIYWTNFAKLSNPNGDLDTSEPVMFECYLYHSISIFVSKNGRGIQNVKYCKMRTLCVYQLNICKRHSNPFVFVSKYSKIWI
jgi:hypothetical protein